MAASKKAAKGKRKPAAKKKKPQEKANQAAGVVTYEQFPGLDSLGDGETIRGFVDAVEGAFEALHQPRGGLGGADEDTAEGNTDVTLSDFRTWADTVEDRMEFMGLQRCNTNLPPANAARDVVIDGVGLQKWTRRVYARFAALGEVLPDPNE